jgi:hypothetical protein
MSDLILTQLGNLAHQSAIIGLPGNSLTSRSSVAITSSWLLATARERV